MEPGQRAAPGHGQARPRRPRLHADHVRRLRLAAALPADGRARHPDRAGAAQPRQRLGVRPAHRRRQERLRADPRHPGRPARPGRGRRHLRRPSPPRPPRRWPRRASSPAEHQFVRTADLRYFGQAFEVRVPVAQGELDPAAGRRRVPRRAQGALRLRLLRRPDPAGRVGQPPRLRHRPDPAPGDPAPPVVEPDVDPASRPGRRAGLLRRRGRVRRHARLPAQRPRPGHRRRRPGDHRGVRLHGAAAPRLQRPDRRVPQPHRDQEPGSERDSEPPRTHPVPVRPPHRGRRRQRRPGARRDRPGLAGQRRDGGRDRHRRAPAAAR